MHSPRPAMRCRRGTIGIVAKSGEDLGPQAAGGSIRGMALGRSSATAPAYPQRPLHRIAPTVSTSEADIVAPLQLQHGTGLCRRCHGE